MGNHKTHFWFYLFLIFIKSSLFANSFEARPIVINAQEDSLDYIHPLDSIEPKMIAAYENGWEAYQIGDYVKADSLWTISLNLRSAILSETDIDLAVNLLNLGAANLKLWNYQYALDLFNQAEKIYTKINENHSGLGAIYANIGIIYTALRDYDEALIYYNHAIFLYKNQQIIDYEGLYRTYTNLSTLFSKTEDYDKAIESITTGIYYDKTKSPSRLIGYNNYMATYHSQIGEYIKAEKYYQAALSLAKRYSGSEFEYSDLPSILMNYGVFKMDQLGDYDKAKSLFFLAYEQYKLEDKQFEVNRTICLHNIGEVYFKMNMLDSALLFFQKSLIDAIPDFKEIDIYQNPTISVENQRTRIVNTLKWKAKVFYKKFNDQADIKDLEFSLQTYLLIYDFIDEMRLKYDSETSNFLVSKQEDETFLNGIANAERLYNITNDAKYLDIAFKINEKRKSFTLLTSIRKTEAKEFGGIPTRLLLKEKNLYNLLAAFEENIFEEERRLKPDPEKIEIWEDNRFQLLQDYNILVKTFEEEYPEYYRLKYDASTITIEQIQGSLGNDEILIEYALTNTTLFEFVITKEDAKIIKRKIDSSFIETIQDVRINLLTPNFSENALNSYLMYCRNSYNLYSYLLDTIEEDIENKSLIIIPDGSLWYIPFEILLTSCVSDSSVNYRKLPYLVRDYPVSYAYSATLHFEANKRKTKPEKGLLAFAPKYSALLAQNEVPEPNNFLEQYREQLVPIPGVKDEVKMINRLVDGDVWMDDEATETRFKQEAEKYDILHLAMHTIVNNEEPMYSKLAFVQNIDSVNDGFLNTYEIYNMRFNARMAVLSSCKTGFGMLMKGEGVMSLARGFMYAGCPSIIMTLWEVSDKSGARLMQDFYKSLIKGKSKAKALQEAKLDFLKTADNLKANPYFWSTYVIIGDTSPMYEKSMAYIYWIFALALIVGGGIGFLIRNKRKNSKGTDGLQPDKMYS